MLFGGVFAEKFAGGEPDGLVVAIDNMGGAGEF